MKKITLTAAALLCGFSYNAMAYSTGTCNDVSYQCYIIKQNSARDKRHSQQARLMWVASGTTVTGAATSANCGTGTIVYNVSPVSTLSSSCTFE